SPLPEKPTRSINHDRYQLSDAPPRAFQIKTVKCGRQGISAGGKEVSRHRHAVGVRSRRVRALDLPSAVAADPIRRLAASRAAWAGRGGAGFGPAACHLQWCLRHFVVLDTVTGLWRR